MAEFLTMDEAKSKFGSKSKTNSALTLGIIGTALAAFGGANGGCCNNGCNNGGIGGILGNILGGNKCCGGGCGCNQQAGAADVLMGMAAANAFGNGSGSCESGVRNVELVPSKYELMQKECEDNLALTRSIYDGRITDLNEKFDLYTRMVDANNVQDKAICDNRVTDLNEKFDLYTRLNSADQANDSKFTKINYEGRIQDLNEKFDLYTRLNSKITDLEKQQAATQATLPLVFELNKVNSERYTDACCCKSEKELLMSNNMLQRQLDHKIDGELKYAYSNLCAPVPNISPLYCTPFTPVGSGTCYNRGCGCGCGNETL